ncbi:alpha-glucuronidase family glycosyl hydrolase [Pelagicoccus sp. SDUM812003]|uniref:alpha-glucuronidase family glycosyl hydrolase n=1 Tax=Pelagicoccus sp. SDUM812003 TaxID=3041267 RepID=UPI002811C260|nr:alpha-glucuronidase family glycosyl hydrolase [Pelagicoccus sp. SDUM812003]
MKTLLLVSLCLMIGVHLGAEVIPIVRSEAADVREKWAASELSRFLEEIYEGDRFPVRTKEPKSGGYILLGTHGSVPLLRELVDDSGVTKPGSFVVKRVTNGGREIGVIVGNNSRGTLDGVYALLEQKLGYGFYLHGNAAENADSGPFSFDKWDLAASPEFQERLVFNWYNFISGVSAWNLDDYKKWIRQSARMRYTSVMLHAYSWSPFHAFSYNGETKPVLRIQNTQYGPLWDNKQTEDIRKLIGGELFEDEGPIFGADVSKVGFDGVTLENRVARAKAMMREVVDYAVNTVGMEFNWVIDVDTGYANPQNVIMTLPEKDRIRMWDRYVARPDTEEGYLYYKNMIETIISDYPGITNLTVWWRANSGTKYDGMVNPLPFDDKLARLPDEWHEEYKAAPDDAIGPDTEQFPTVAPANLFYAKVTEAFRNALDELGRSEVKLGYGSWIRSNEEYTSFFPANYFQDEELTAYALEYNMKFDTNEAFRERLRRYGEKRNLVVIEWAHHDDGMYLGRPYTPPTDFADKLHESRAHGFGVIHWMTKPLDVFFKNLQNQIWSDSLNESYLQTCEKVAYDYFGPTQAEQMANYLAEWWTTAPQFGRETGLLGQTNVGDFDDRIAGCERRIALLEAVDTSGFSGEALARWRFFKGHEEWIALFHQAQRDWDLELQKATILKYIEKGTAEGPMTRGEEGILIQHNLKWLDTEKEHKRMAH